MTAIRRYGDTAIRRYGDTAIRRYGDTSSKLANVKQKKKKSFTLVEVVFTISIIGILMAILLPAVSAAKLAAKKAVDISNLKKIAEAWRECVINRGWTIGGRTLDVHYRASCFAAQLAGHEKTDPSDMVLNDPYVYISPGDKYASKIRAESIAIFDGKKINGRPTEPTKENYVIWATNVSNPLIAHGCLISYVLACNLPSAAPLETTPLAFTRGLREDGKWDERAGLYGSKGGYVLFCDGHVTWFDGSNPAKFLKWDQLGYSTNIEEAVPDSAFFTCGDAYTNTNYKSEDSGKPLVILRCAGAGGK
jgi:prepilin-type processing-associated H-X9-DG protein